MGSEYRIVRPGMLKQQKQASKREAIEIKINNGEATEDDEGRLVYVCDVLIHLWPRSIQAVVDILHANFQNP
ncbi:unnamed protein product [Adineta ricciae]|uniref:Uncharacterized protein n=1 Tax=Adineta ricciae TaxID=249248 RepID=A0A814R4L4_ADIRI|nr:unnamed protein product [Adineta ricciae]